jgi:hypothetical protein
VVAGTDDADPDPDPEDDETGVFGSRRFLSL